MGDQEWETPTRLLKSFDLVQPIYTNTDSMYIVAQPY